MSKRKSPKRINRGVNLPEEIHEALEKHKEATGVPISRFVTDAVKAALAR